MRIKPSSKTISKGRRAHLAMALAEVVQIECDGKCVGELSLFCPGMLREISISIVK